MRKCCWLFLVIFSIVCCSRVHIVKVDPETPYEEGIKFYRPHPYLWITKGDKGELKGSIIWLPNMKEEYAIKVKPGLGSIDVKFTLENGWNLTQFGETMDSKTPELIEALTGSLSGIKDILETVTEKELKPGLYAFIFDDKSGLVINIEPVVQFK